MEYNFKHIKHWEFITPKEAIRYAENELKAFIVNYFNKHHFLLQGREDDIPDENLLFSLIEVITVNINDLRGVGDTFIYSYLPKDEVDFIFNNYFNLLEKFKKEKTKFITEYSNWYYKDVYLLQLSKGDSPTSYNNNAVYKWHSVGISSKDESMDNLVEELEDNKIVEYLNEYANKVIPTLRLDKCPHSFILIKPVSLIDHLNNIKPIGNFFFHISVKEKLSEVQVINFLHLFLLTWLKKHWNIIFKNENIVATVQSFNPIAEKNENYHYINTQALSEARKLFGDKNINDYLRYFSKVEKEKNNNQFYTDFITEILPIIISNLFAIKAKKKVDETLFSNYIYTVQPKSFKAIDKSLDKTKELIITHLIIKMAILIFDIHFAQILDLYRHKIFDFTAYKETTDTANAGDLKIYLQRDRFIYLGCHDTENIQEIKSNMKSRLNDFEKNMFSSCIEILRRRLDICDNNSEKEILNTAISNTKSALKNN